MRPTLAQLSGWYATLQGRRVARVLGRIVAPTVRVAPNARLLALGYAAPVLMGFDPARVERLAMAMPGAQGSHRWPARRPNHAIEVDPLALPFAAGMFDQALVIHALEFAEPPRLLLRELWRVLAPAGQIIVVVPNRLGPWTHLGASPFGEGRPYGRGQLNRLLADAMFEPYAQRTALVTPPVGLLRPLGAAVGAVAGGLGGARLALARKTDGLRPAMAGRAAPARAALATRGAA